MKTEKMSFKNIKDVLSRDEMKGIMAGSGGGGSCTSCIAGGISYYCAYSAGIGGRPAECTCSSSGSNGTGCKVQ